MERKYSEKSLAYITLGAIALLQTSGGCKHEYKMLDLRPYEERASQPTNQDPNSEMDRWGKAIEAAIRDAFDAHNKYHDKGPNKR